MGLLLIRKGPWITEQRIDHEEILNANFCECSLVEATVKHSALKIASQGHTM